MRLASLVIYDFETGGLNPHEVEITQVAAVALCPKTLEPHENGTFDSEMRPLRPDLLSDEALAVTRKCRERLAEAPTPEEVWGRFTSFCRQWCVEGKVTNANLPIAAGHNITGYDNIILQRYCEIYGPTKLDKRSGREIQTLFNTQYQYDTLQLMNYWTESLVEPKWLSLDKLRQYFGMPKGSIAMAHDALQDVLDTAAILKKLLGLSRRHAPGVIFKDCFDAEKVQAEVTRRKKLKEKRK